MNIICLKTYTNKLTINIHGSDPDYTTLTRSQKCIAAMLDLEKRLG